jgi:23S rRNA pseudouridine955/2504/2580 synthase
MREIVIQKNDAGQRLDKFLSKALPSLPPSKLYKSIRTKKIKVNRRRAEIGQVLAVGDTLQLFLAENFFTDGRSDEGASTLASVRTNLDVVYEDENILLLNKRPGVSVHEDANGANDSLILHIKAYLFQKGEYVPEDEQSFAPALCNRIDRNTGGIVIAAKNAEALRVMNEMIKERRIDKFYLCAVHGAPKPRENTISGYLLKDEVNNTVRIYDKNPPRGAKQIVTRYRTLSVREGISLLEVELLTGRTHQIRAHLAHIGHPLLGDGKYGINRADRARGYKYQALWSYRLRFSFGGEECLLSYLDGKEFSVPYEKIYFLKDFLPLS